MKQRVTNGVGLAKACCFTAILNSAITDGISQEVIMSPPDSGMDRAGQAFHYGPFDFRPSLRGGVSYDDNIYIQPVGEEEDLIWNLSPGLLIGAGDYVGREANLFTLEYAPNFIVFTENDGETTVEHAAKALIELNEERWRLTLSQEYQKLAGAVIDVGTRVDRNVFTTSGLFDYEISPKTSFDIEARMFINDYDGASDYNQWTFGTGVDYAVTPKVTLGVGGVFGVVDVSGSPNQTYEQLLLRGSYELSEKVTARGSIGGETRQFQGGGDDANLVFAVGGTYKVRENTMLAFDGYRRVQNSVVAVGENYTTLGVSLGVRQTIRELYGVYGVLGYENADYSSHSSSLGTSRDDDYYLLRGGADWSVTDQLALGVYYQYRKNNSSTPAVDFNNNQVGLTASYQF